MKVNCGTIYSGLQTIIDLSEKPMKVSLAAKLLRLSNDLTEETKLIEKQRNDLLERYGRKDQDGKLIIENGKISFEDKDIEKIQNEFNELSNLEIEIPNRNITEEEIENSGLELTLNQLSILNNFIEKK